MNLLKNGRRLDKEESDVLKLFDKEHHTSDKSAGGSPNVKTGTLLTKAPIKMTRQRIIIIAVLCAILLILFIGFLVNQPRLKLKGDESMTVEAATEYKEPGASASYYAFNCSKKIKIEGAVDTSTPGTYTVSYSITKGDKTKTATRTVNVVDTTAPTLQLTGDAQMTASAWRLYKEPGFTAVDSCDGDITASVQVSDSEQDGSHVLTYTVSDRSGNTSTAVRTVTVSDTVAPEIFLVGKDTLWVETDKPYTEPGVFAVDDVDGVVTESIKVSGAVNTGKAGEYDITYTVGDSSGNVATKMRKIKVAPLSSIPEDERTANANMIYLTFDDGPSAEVTPRILDILKQYNIKATFFICGYSDSNKAIVQRAIDEGHTIGIHGYTHDWTAYSSDENYLNNIKTLHDKLLADTGYNAEITRFLGGSSNTVSKKYSEGIMTRLSAEVIKAGYQYFDWNTSSGDAESKTVPAETIVSNVKGSLKPNRNNIVLMHDAKPKSTTADALPAIIEYGLSNGYSFAALTRDTIPVHHSINN